MEVQEIRVTNQLGYKLKVESTIGPMIRPPQLYSDVNNGQKRGNGQKGSKKRMSIRG
jgi:hypothetical protein